MRRPLARKLLTLLLGLVAAALAAAAAPAARAAFLDQCPCAPTDRDLFATFIYPDAAPMTLAPDPGDSPIELAGRVRAELRRLLEDRPPDIAARALAVFESPLTAAKVPDVRLRAALAVLVGTNAEPALETILGDSVTLVEFGVLPLLPHFLNDEPVPVFGLTASLSGRDAGKYVIVVSRRYQHEHFALLAPILVHEALHVGGPDNGRPEEVVNALLGNTFVTAELVADHPEIAAGRTELSRWFLSFVAGLLFNSRTPLEARGPEGLAPGSPLVLPGLYPVWYPSTETTTPGTPLLRALLENYGLEPPPDVAFSKELVAELDIDEMRRTFLSDDDLRRLGSDVLRLDLDVTVSGAVLATSRRGARLLVQLDAGEGLQASATLLRRSRPVSRVDASLAPGRRTVALPLPPAAAGRHLLVVELRDAYDNVATVRRSLRLASA